MRKNIIQIVLSIFFLFPNLPLRAEGHIFEAEKCELTGSAIIVNSTLCSGGRKVGGMGSVDKNGGVKITFNIVKSGKYQIGYYYLANDPRNFQVTLNADSPRIINCTPTGSWDTPGVVYDTLDFQAGLNTLIIDNNTDYAPDLDLIIINEVRDTMGVPQEFQEIHYGNWNLKVNIDDGNTTLIHNNLPVLNKCFSSFKNGDSLYFSYELEGISIKDSVFEDELGIGKLVSITGTYQQNEIKVTRRFYLYEGVDYLLTDMVIESPNPVESNYMAAIVSDTLSETFNTGTNKALWVPYDNDYWVRYQTLDFGIPYMCYEVSALINSDSRKGVVIGSVNHDLWKTGIRMNTQAPGSISRVEVFGGASSNQTRDVIDHGKVKGNSIKSPKVLIGTFDDWRRGMETFADVNETFAPKLPWNKGKPFGWNSWGVLQTNLSYSNASQVSSFFAGYLQPAGFSNDSTVYIGLDSFWDNITYSDLKKFTYECAQKGQKAGIYWTPFVDWAKNPDRQVEGAPGTYYRDIYLYANGEHQVIAGGWAVDPTHPATKKRMDLYLQRFIDQGFSYLKLDFMCHGTLESDYHYDPNVFTGIQAYNQGMEYLINYLDGRLFLNLSIAPLFPSQYAHSRRIACDAYASINDSEYTLNSTSYGWWLDHVYTYNDGDNIVFNGVSTGENRARLTSSVITGIICTGDDYSDKASSTVKTRALAFLTNTEINRIAKTTKAFSPVEISNGGAAADMFIQKLGDTTYLAVFNYSASTVEKLIDFDRVGLKTGNRYVVHELWRNTQELQTGSFNTSIPKKDVLILKIYEGELSTSFKESQLSHSFLYPNPFEDIVHINGDINFLNKIYVSDLTGSVVKILTKPESSFSLGELSKGLYLLTAFYENGVSASQKLIKE